MEKVKTYHKINATNEYSNFSISRMEDIYTIRGGKVDEPHRHDFFTVLVIEQAQGIHKVDFNTYPLESQQVFFVSPGQVHQVIEKVASTGFVMTFSSQFLIENSVHISFIESLNLFHDYGESPPLKPTSTQFAKLKSYTAEIFQLFNSEAKMKNLSIGSFLKLFLIDCNIICSCDPTQVNEDISENRIIRAFKKEVERSFKIEHSTTHYAKQLNLSADHLNRIIKTTIGKTSKEYIQSRIMIEAKRLLFFSKLSAKEIGFELGFSEPANFSAFFKKHAKCSPSNFKKKELNIAFS